MWIKEAENKALSTYSYVTKALQQSDQFCFTLVYQRVQSSEVQHIKSHKKYPELINLFKTLHREKNNNKKKVRFFHERLRLFLNDQVVLHNLGDGKSKWMAKSILTEGFLQRQVSS